MTNIAFPDGIPGFREITSWDLLRVEDTSPILYLCSEDRSIKLPVVVPWSIDPDYEVQVANEDISKVGEDAEWLTENLVVLTVVRLTLNPTMNRYAPILIDEAECVGYQMVNTAGGYSTRDPIRPNSFPLTMTGFDLATTDARLLHG